LQFFPFTSIQLKPTRRSFVWLLAMARLRAVLSRLSNVPVYLLMRVVVCGKFKSAREGQGQEESRNPTPIAGYRKEVDNFVLTLESCKRVDENVRCQVNILNKGKKRVVGLTAPSSSLVDLAGKSHPGYRADLGKGSGAYTNATIESKNDFAISITFENIPGQVVKAQLLNLAFDGEMKPIQFRNIPISN
jgi:hypothetical protein